MATLESDDSNILDAEMINWRLVVYPILAALVVVVGGFGYYYFLQNQREELEVSARAALVQAKTSEELVKVADQFPGADQGTLALLSAASLSFDKKDYAAAIKDYKRVLFGSKTDEILAESARLGFASSLEAANKVDDETSKDATDVYLREGDLGKSSPYAPYAYFSAARLYEEKNDKDNERKILTEAASLDPDSPFVKQAQLKLKEMETAAQPPQTVTAPAPAQK
jgi:predicted negative regulator of RcsB-dependent stress response